MARKILASVALFIALYLGLHFYIRWRNTVTDDVTKLGRLVDCKPNEVSTITILQGSDGRTEKLHFWRTDQPIAGVPESVEMEQWSWRGESALSPFAADPARMRRIASNLCEIYDPMQVRPGEFHPETSPRRLARVLEAGFSSGPPAKLEFGELVKNATVVRYTRDGRERLVVLPDQFMLELSLATESYRNLKVVRTDADDVQRARLLVDGKERFTLERAGADWLARLDGKAKGAGSEEAGKFVNRIATVRAIGIEGEGFSAADCAAMPAKAIVELRDVLGREEVIRLSYAKGTDVTVCSSLGSQKFRVHHDLVPFVDVAVKSVLAR